MARSATATLAAVLLALVLAVPGSADTKGDLTAAQKQLHGLEDQIAAEQGAIASLQAQADGIAAQRPPPGRPGSAQPSGLGGL